MPPRNAKRPCHNCPQPKPKAKPATTPEATLSPTPAIPPAPLSLTEYEGLRLWKHVIFGTGTCVKMIEGYAEMDMPGDPMDGIVHLRDRLNQVINLLQDRNNGQGVPPRQ